SARPVEYDAYLPGSARLAQHTISDGPYQISSYRSGRWMVLLRNPVWSQASDDLRHQFVRRIVVSMGVANTSAIVAGERSGRYDLGLDTRLAPGQLAALSAAGDPRLRLWPGGNIAPYLVFNIRDGAGPMAKRAVRRAIESAGDKSAVQRALGGPAAAGTLSTMLPPGTLGYRAYDRYPTAGGRGDPGVCRRRLAHAGYPQGLTVRYWYPGDSRNVAVYHVIARSLGDCGIRLDGRSWAAGRLAADLRNARANGRSDAFDIA